MVGDLEFSRQFLGNDLTPASSLYLEFVRTQCNKEQILALKHLVDVEKALRQQIDRMNSRRQLFGEISKEEKTERK